MKAKNGFRKGMDWKELMPTLTDEDKEWMRQKKEAEEFKIENKDAYKCAARTDQMFQKFDESFSMAESIMCDVLTAKRTHDLNRQDIIKGETAKVCSNTGVKMAPRDLEIENFMMINRVNDGRRKLWLILADLFRYTNVTRIDREKMFSIEAYQKLVDKIKFELKKQGVDLYEERN